MARSTGTAKPPAKRATPFVRASSDRDRERRALDNAARRVPVWQVSITSGLMAVRDAPGTDAELKARIGLALAQVPPAVVRAAEMHRAGRWTPL